MEDSVFTKIIKGELPCYKIYEDEKTFAFLDNHPAIAGHTLVVPKNQVDKFYELPDDDYQAMMATVKKLAQRMEKVLGKRPIIKIIGIDVPHAHVHVMPFEQGIDTGELKPPKLSEEDMKAMQEKLAF